MSALDRAIEIATEAHAGQVDKAGRDYILHPLSVMEGVSGETAKIVAVLHDVLEDTAVTVDDLRAAGFGDDVLVPLVGVTREDGETYSAFIRRAGADPVARVVKVADLRDNLSEARRLPGEEQSERRARYESALAHLVGLD